MREKVRRSSGLGDTVRSRLDRAKHDYLLHPKISSQSNNHDARIT